jgi:hypothetical protein
MLAMADRVNQKSLLDHEFSWHLKPCDAARFVAFQAWCVARRPQIERIAKVRATRCVPQEGAPGLVKFR